MSLDTLGINDVTPEMQDFKDKLASKDAQIAAQQNQLLKKVAEFEELQATLNDTLHKLTQETQRALRLETDLSKCSEDLRSEKIASQNAQGAFERVQETVKAKELETRELEATLESLSHTSDNYRSHREKTEREKATLEARVKELEANICQLKTIPVTPGRPPRARSSSVSNLKITTLEYELNDLKGTLTERETDLKSVSQKLEGAQRELTKVSNEKMALESRNKKRIDDLQERLQEKEEELEFLRSGNSDQGREEELLNRIEEDEAKIEALSKLAGEAHELPNLKRKLAKTEESLKLVTIRLEEAEGRNAELVAEKEEALDSLEEARAENATLNGDLRSKDAQMEVLKSNCGTRSDEGVVADMERLLAAVDRLRAERDNLRRDLEYLEMESKFTITALEAKVAALSNTTNDDHMDVDSPPQQPSLPSRSVEALAVVVNHLQRQVESLESTATSSQAEQDHRLHDAQSRLQTTVEMLEETTVHRNELLSQMQTEAAEWQAKIEQVERAHQETKDSLERLDVQLGEAHSSLEEVESERNSLNLQVTNLAAELTSAQKELAEAERRYSSLQFHQLSNMSSTEATRALRVQIEQLEGRVMRRTEQIGIQQHDIKRLETNLRLQEERLTEMTAEMETLAAQKDAMVEDCADARETRDDALARVERLEEEIERLEESQDERERALTAIVGVVFQTADRARRNMNLVGQRQKVSNEELQSLRQEYASKCEEITHLALELDSTKHHLAALLEEHRQTAAELATSQAELSRRLSSSQDLEDARIGLVQVIDELQQQLASRTSEMNLLASQLEALRKERVDDLENHSAKVSNLEGEIQNLQTTLSCMESEHQATVEEMRGRISEKDQLLANNEVESELVQLKVKHVEEVGQLQSRLVEANALLEETKARHAAAEVEHQKLLTEASQSRQTLESELAQLKQLHENLSGVREEYTVQLDELRDQLSGLSEELELTRQSKDQVVAEHQRAVNEFEQSRIDNEQALQKVQEEVQQLRRDLSEQSASLEHANAEVALLDARLQKEAEERTKDQSLHEEEIQSLEERHQQAESLAHQLSRQVVSIQAQLETADNELQALQEEKNVYQRDMTAREGEVQRYLSLNRYLETQIKESEGIIESLRSEIKQTSERLAQVEKVSKSAEVNLTLQTTHHKREVAQLQQEIQNLKSRTNLEPVVAELEERINEMEELLRRKCEEIEKHDDQTYEIMKENKSLKTKVESLTRKTQNLQTKLAAAKASLQTGEKEESRRSPPSTFTVSPSAPPVPQASTSRPRSTAGSRATSPADVPAPRPRYNTLSTPTSTSPPADHTPPVFDNRSRAVSGTSALPRPKTPERRSVLGPVFRAVSPKKKASDPDIPTPTAGKKRRTPDDFEDCANVPPQAFTSDSLPEDSRETPRARRVLSSIQSGFTPVRNQSRPIIPLPSPKRSSVTQPMEPDLSNPSHPRTQSMSAQLDSKPSKSWLGKIRGASTSTHRSKLV